jgi:hypothetical protein
MGRITPHQPMRAAQTPVTQDRMQEILSKNSSKAAQSRNEKSGAEPWPVAPKETPASGQPPRPIGKLIWADREPGSMGRYTSCHWYSCCQIVRGAEVTFEVWTRAPLTGGMKQLVIGLKSFKDGIEAAQKDADEHYAQGDR